MAANKFGEYIASCHAALTAEGDNRVLMVKVVKDMIVNHFKKGAKLPEFKEQNLNKEADLLNLHHLSNIFRKR